MALIDFHSYNIPFYYYFTESFSLGDSFSVYIL